MVKTKRVPKKNGQSVGGRARTATTGRTKPGSRPKKSKVVLDTVHPVTNVGESAASEQTTGPGRRSMRIARKQELSAQATPSQRRQDLPVSSSGVVKKQAAKMSASKGNANRLSSSSIWKALQSAPSSVSKMLAPAMSPFSNLIGSASQAVSSTFNRILAPTPSPAVLPESDRVSAVADIQMKLEAKAP